MKRSFIPVVLLCLLFFVSFGIASATLTFGFGGKIIADKISGVTCSSGGTVLILSSEIGGAVSAVSSGASNGSAGQKTTGIVSGLNKTIPYYVENGSKKPKEGQSILGNAELAIDSSTCKIKIGKSSIPFPIRKVKNFNLSKN